MDTPEDDKKIPITVVVGFLGAGRARFEYAKITLSSESKQLPPEGGRALLLSPQEGTGQNTPSALLLPLQARPPS